MLQCSRTASSADLDNDFTKMTTFPEVVQRFFGFWKCKYLIHHWSDLMLFVELQKLLEPISWPVQQSLQGKVLLDCIHVDVESLVRRVDLPRNISYAIDKASKLDAVV